MPKTDKDIIKQLENEITSLKRQNKELEVKIAELEEVILKQANVIEELKVKLASSRIHTRLRQLKISKRSRNRRNQRSVAHQKGIKGKHVKHQSQTK